MRCPRLLVVEDDEYLGASLAAALASDYDVVLAPNIDAALRGISPAPAMALIDIRLAERDRDNKDGLVLLQELRAAAPDVPALIMTAHSDVALAVECMRLGAADFIEKPISSVGELRARLARALEHRALRTQVGHLEQELSRVYPREIVGTSPAVVDIRSVIEAAARDGSVSLLVTGETGTGKELVARAIHAAGRRRKGPFIPVMLNALPASMMEAELFGVEPGAFTDATERRVGYFERAHGGVLFLDEIGEIEPAVQVKLLRFLEERQFQRLGSTQPISVDVQVVAATNADLASVVQAGRFRADLYYRLNVHQLRLPPLRDRAEDIPVLVKHFISVFRQQGKRVIAASDAALGALAAYGWPGNARELRNTVESAIFRAEMAGRTSIDTPDLPLEVGRTRPAGPGPAAVVPSDLTLDLGLDEILARTELTCVSLALSRTSGRKIDAASLLRYRDRYALYRSVHRLMCRYPHLEGEFGDIWAAFGAGKP
jgi:two-component system response regulator AtoC